MSQKKFMHPRNIYNNPPDFNELAAKYPEFRSHVTLGLSGKAHFSFKDADAVRALSRALLKRDFDLDVVIPADTLIPTVPLRLNYVLWIEDLLSLGGSSEDVKGIDIGTGASCVYPLIMAKKNRWNMVGTDIDARSAECAQENVLRNELVHLIYVKLVSASTLLSEVLDSDSCCYDFCMCNPPFFGSSDELSSFLKARKKMRPPPKNAFVGSPNEVITAGGEVEFVVQLIRESVQYKHRVKIFSSMVGVKRDLKPIKQVLVQSGIASYKETEFSQGRTARWGLAWTFTNIDLTKTPDYTGQRKKKQAKTFVHTIESSTPTIGVVDAELQRIFDELEIKFTALQRMTNFVAYNIIAYSNTWSHKRRKRREEDRLKKASEPELPPTRQEIPGCMEPHCGAQGDLDFTKDLDVDESGAGVKRKPQETESADVKRMKTSHEGNAKEKYLEATVYAKRRGGSVQVELVWITGTAGKDVLHQVLQYVKNHIKVTPPDAPRCEDKTPPDKSQCELEAPSVDQPAETVYS